MSENHKPIGSQSAEEFVRLFSKSQHHIVGFVQILIPSLHDAEEVVQETSIILWKKWSQYDPERDFVKWACGIARYEAFRFLRKKRHPLHLSDAVLNQIADLALAQATMDSHDRECMDALKQCVDGLQRKEKELLTMRYRRNTPVAKIADEIGLARSTVFESLHKIRSSLLRCVKRRLKHVEGTW